MKKPTTNEKQETEPKLEYYECSATGGMFDNKWNVKFALKNVSVEAARQTRHRLVSGFLP